MAFSRRSHSLLVQSALKGTVKIVTDGMRFACLCIQLVLKSPWVLAASLLLFDERGDVIPARGLNDVTDEGRGVCEGVLAALSAAAAIPSLLEPPPPLRSFFFDT